MPDNSNHGKFIRTHKGNLLVCIEINGKDFFFAMTPAGLRFTFKHERERGMYLNIKEWQHALDHWDNAKVEALTDQDLKNAMDLGPLVAKDFTFGMSSDEIKGLPDHHVKKFK